MAQRVKLLAAKSDDLRLILRAHKMEGQYWLLKAVPWLHKCALVCAGVHVYTDAHTNVVIFKNQAHTVIDLYSDRSSIVLFLSLSAWGQFYETFSGKSQGRQAVDLNNPEEENREKKKKAKLFE